jgi:hypothetical protein
VISSIQTPLFITMRTCSVCLTAGNLMPLNSKLGIPKKTDVGVEQLWPVL